MFITAVCLIFLIKLRWPKTKNLYKKYLIQIYHGPGAIVPILEIFVLQLVVIRGLLNVH